MNMLSKPGFTKRFTQLVAIGLAILLCVVGWLIAANLPIANPDMGTAQVGILIFIFLYVVLSALSYSIPPSVEVGLQSLATVGAYITLGPAAGIATIFIGAPITEVVKYLPKKISTEGKYDPVDGIVWILYRVAVGSFAIIIAEIVYSVLGGPDPLKSLSPSLLIPITALFVINLIFNKLPRLAYLQMAGMLNRTELMEALPELLFAELFPLPLAILLSISYYGLTLPAFILELGGAIVAALLFRESQRSRWSLKRRVKELATLNTIGQSISARLSFDDLLQSMYDQVSRLVEMHTFYIVLYDKGFAFVMEHGRRVTETPQKNLSGVSHYVMHSGKPLLLSGDVNTQLQKMGITSIESALACFMGVPLVADNEVVGMFALINTTNSRAFTSNDVDVISTVAAQAAVAIRNAGLYNRQAELVNQLEQVNRDLGQVNRVSSMVTSTLDLDAVLKTTMNIVKTEGKADKAAIFLADQDGGKLRIADSVGLSEDYVAQFQNLSSANGLTRVLQQREVMAIADVYTDDRALGWRTLSEFEGLVGMLTVPLVASEQIIGFLAAFYRDSHPFPKTEIDLMTTLANQVAVTVSNARLLQDAQSRALEMTQLADASRAFAGSLDLNSVAQTVLDKLIGVLAPDKILLTMLDHNNTLLRTLAGRGDNVPDTLTPIGSIVQVINTNKALTLPNNAEDLEFLKLLGMASLFVLPFVSQDKVFGLVMIGFETTRWFTARERQLTDALVNQAAIAIRNAQLFSQADEALADRVAELSAIEEISRKISGSLDLQEIINDVLKVSEQVIGAEVAGCALVSDTGYLTIMQHESDRTRWHVRPPAEKITSDEGVVGRVLRTGIPSRIPDVRVDPDYIPWSGEGEVLSELCVPIEHNGERVGVINLESHRLNAFTESDERFLMNLAKHAAIAIDNARLLEERQHQIDILIEFRNLSLELLRATTTQQVMNLIVEYALLIAGARDVCLYMYDHSADTLTFGASLWTDGRENIEPAPLKRGGVSWLVARTGLSHAFPDLNMTPNAEIFRDPLPTGAFACIPIKRAGFVLGVLNISYYSAHHFSDDELGILDLLANQAAIAIEDVRLFNEVSKGREQMQTILDSARDGMILIGQRGELVLANNAAENLLGYPIRNDVGKNLLRQIIAARRTDPELHEALTLQMHEEITAIKLAPENATRRSFQVHGRDVEETTLPVMDSNGHPSGRLLVLRDISEERSMERFRNEVTNMMVHDLRSPLGNVISCLRYLQEMAQAGQYDDFDLVLQTALVSSDDQMHMIEAILEIARLETGRMPLKDGVWPLNNIVQRAIATMETTASESHIQLLNCIPIDLPLLGIDEDQVRRVLINLMDNAVRHTPVKGEVRVEAFVQNNKPFVQVGVIDTGKGIPPESRERVFEKFVQVPKSALRGRRGIGLGLTFCRLAIEAHGGRIWVESGPEGGAAFWFTLPIARKS